MVEQTEPLLSDQMPGALHPVATPRFFGHDLALQTLEESFGSGRFHHGWIFSGVQGVGKATLAYHLARVLLADEGLSRLRAGDGLLDLSQNLKESKTGRLVAQFAHPDMRVLRRAYDPRGKKFFTTIRIDDMRALRDMLHTTSSMGGHRVVIIDRAEDMNEASGNALLKVLEEPPSKTVFFLITNSLGLIPITIRSRCQILKFHGLAEEPFAQALRQQFEVQELAVPPALDSGDLWHLTDGSVRAGFELVMGQGLKFYQLLIKLLDGLPVLDGRLLEQFVEGVLKDKSGGDYQSAKQIKLDLLYRLIKGRAAQMPLSAAEQRLADKLIDVQALDQWFEVWDTLNQKSLDVDTYNLDKKTHLMSSFFNLRELVRGA